MPRLVKLLVILVVGVNLPFIGCIGKGVGLEVHETPAKVTIQGKNYRLQFWREQARFELQVSDAQGQFRNVTVETPVFSFVSKTIIYSNSGCRAKWFGQRKGEMFVVGWNCPLLAFSEAPKENVWSTVHFFCTDEGILVRFQLHSQKTPEGKAICWAMPLFRLDEKIFDAYTFWDYDGKRRSGRIANLGEQFVYAGVSPWGSEGDTTNAFFESLPALIVRSESNGVGLGVVFVNYANDWHGEFGFLQRYNPNLLFFYSGFTSAKKAEKGIWAWLAPFDGKKVDHEERVRKLLKNAERIVKTFKPVVSSEMPPWLKTPPDFPAELCRSKPIERIEDAAVFSINEFIHLPYGIWLARKVGSDVLLRGWFKWGNAPDWKKFSSLAEEARQLGMLFGGGTTCSALFHGENNLSEEEVLDMATRDPEGNLVDAWGLPNCRHGTLSNPRYLDYILRWCREQIEAGADCLFMDEIDAALHPNEGFDDYSLRDFREHLLQVYVKGQGWRIDDDRWQKQFRVDFSDKNICPDGTMRTFNYRAYLKRHGFAEQSPQNPYNTGPFSPENPFREEWIRFRRERDERAWHYIVEKIREFARQRNKKVFVCANGIAKFVDFQVRGIWDLWKLKDGRVDLNFSQMKDWASVVREGWFVSGRKVPVLLFHDWGFGFPWTEVPPSDREIWIRVRGSEIYASGGFFAFPVSGLANSQDAFRDGTLDEIARQTAFYQKNSRLYKDAIPIAFDELQTKPEQLSTALWVKFEPPTLLVHIINRQMKDFQLRKGSVDLWIPVKDFPQKVNVFSPDDTKKDVKIQWDGKQLTLTLAEIEAYSVIELQFKDFPKWSDDFAPKLRPLPRWERAPENTFVVRRGGIVENDWQLVSFLQGKLHTRLRNPPTFIVNAPKGGKLEVFIRSVAVGGALLVLKVDGVTTQTVLLPDKDKQNIGQTNEYDQVFTFEIPAGEHRITLDNEGSDWAFVDWLAFRGEFDEPKTSSRAVEIGSDR
ncbi:MAG: hypothetical protein NZ937_07560 [Armatimonadetes bacterium]|nr:hypothetical protein [Armatimonadota bacterium]